MPEACPACGKLEYVRERCGECPVKKLDAALDSLEGDLLRSAAEIDADIQAGLTVTRHEMSVLEYRAYILLRSERARWERQRPKRDGEI